IGGEFCSFFVGDVRPNLGGRDGAAACSCAKGESLGQGRLWRHLPRHAKPIGGRGFVVLHPRLWEGCGFILVQMGGAGAGEPDAARQNLMSVRSILDGPNKAVTIAVDQDDLATLNANNYAMCFAKRVASDRNAGVYNVVWRSLTSYGTSTSFSWTWQFAL